MAIFVWAAAAGSTWATGANWKVGGVAQANPPTAADDAVFGTGTGATNNNCTTATGDVCRSLTIDNAYTGTFTLANSATALTIGDASGGALSIGTGVTWTNTGLQARINFVSSSTNGGAGWPVTTNGKTVANMTFNNAAGLWVFQDAVSLPGSNLTTLRVGAGELRTNGKTVTLTNNGAGLQNQGTLTTGGSAFNFAITITGTFWNNTGTVNGAGSTITLTAASANTRTFAGGGGTYGTLTYTVAGSTGQLTITGSNSFVAINFSDVTNARTLALTAGTTTTITTAAGLSGLVGTAGKLMSLVSTAAGSAATLAHAFPAIISQYLSVKDITSSTTHYAQNSTNVSGNTGWVFAFLTATVNQITGSDAGQTISPAHARALGQTSETDLSRPVTGAHQRAMAQIIETSLAQAFSGAHRASLGQTTETDLARALAAAHARTLGQTTETDLAQALSGAHLFTLGQATETDLAQALAAARAYALAQVIETDLAQLLTPAHQLTLGQTTETDLAQALTAAHLLALGRADEVDLAQALLFSITVLVGQAEETDDSKAIQAARIYALGQVTETDLARLVTFARGGIIGQATETDSVRAVIWYRDVHVLDFYLGTAPPPDNDLLGTTAPRMLTELLEGERGLVPKHISLHLVSAIPSVSPVGSLHISLTFRLKDDAAVEDFYLGRAPEPDDELLGDTGPRMLAYVGDDI